MVNTRASELATLQNLLRRAAYVRAVLGDGRDSEIVIDDLMTALEVPDLKPYIDRLASYVDDKTADLAERDRRSNAPVVRAD